MLWACFRFKKIKFLLQLRMKQSCRTSSCNINAMNYEFVPGLETGLFDIWALSRENLIL